MAKLRALHNGQLLGELNLQSGLEYFIGRSDQCAIVLPEERGISRQHLKLSQENGIWIVTKLSRFGNIDFAGQQVESLPLDNDLTFNVSGFEFIFEILDRPQEIENLSPSTEENDRAVPEVTPSFEGDSSEGIQDFASRSDDTSPGNFEATRAGASHLVAYLKIFNQNTQLEETLKLEGHLWTLGRSPASEIYVNDAAISRKHFELSQTAEGYFITDFNSSNGTDINGEMIEPQVPYQIRSGDIITIKNIKITFEIRNTEFEKMLARLPVVVEEPLPEDSHYDPGTQVHSALALSHHQQPLENSPEFVKVPGVIRLPPQKGWQVIARNRKAQIGAAFLALALIWVLTDEPAKTPEAKEGQHELGSQKEVTPEQMGVVREKYELAKKNYFERGNYTFCRDLLAEVHQIVPFIEDSKNLASLCEQSIELQLIRQEREEKEKKKAEAENKIRNTVENCRSQYNETITLAQMQECLNPAIELDPGSTDAQVLLQQVQDRDLKKKELANNREAYARQILAGRNHFSRAQRLQQAGQLRAALSEYSSFVQKGYPGLQQEELEAQRAIAGIRGSIDAKITAKINACRSALNQSQMKTAIGHCDQALKEDPKNGEALELKKSAIRKLQRTLRSLYEDSRLEESMGNVEAAKQKWRKIKDDSFPGEEFYEKAKNMLRKYEG